MEVVSKEGSVKDESVVEGEMEVAEDEQEQISEDQGHEQDPEQEQEEEYVPQEAEEDVNPSESSPADQPPQVEVPQADNNKEEAAPSLVPPTTPKPLVPSLKGTMSYVGGVIYCKGKWAMSDVDHATPTLTSDFEFRLISAEDGNSGSFPINGTYQGWFSIKQPQPLKSIKVEDKEMVMKFTPKDDNIFDIQGQGHNQYGKFNLRGTVTADGATHIYREYYFLNPTPVVVAAIPKKVERRVSIDKKALEVKVEAPPMLQASPRETARVRKPSSILKEAQQDILVPKTPKPMTPKETLKPSTSFANMPPPVPMSRQNSVERTHRMVPAFKKCMELLKDLSRLPQAIWFLEPVDPIKYNIPDYPKIIKNPMDFSTIRTNIEKGIYESIDEFADHVRLVFRNAVTFNTSKDAAVHVAAKDLGGRFEDKFRQLVVQLDPEFFPLPVEPKAKTFSSAKKFAPPPKVVRETSFSAKPMKAATGPRPLPPAPYVPSIAIDGSTQLILEMQRKMETMEAELSRLRGAVQEQRIIQKVEETKEAAYNPLTLDEKKALVAQIYKLTPEKMEKALDIIREAIDPSDDAEVEIPLDSLDTLTLRKLQKFIQDNTDKKKRSISAPSLSRQSSSKPGASGEPSSKKPRKSKSTANNLMAGDGDLSLFDDQDTLLFEENFEELRNTKSHTPQADHSNGYHGSFTHHDQDDEEDDDDNKWERAANDNSNVLV